MVTLAESNEGNLYFLWNSERENREKEGVLDELASEVQRRVGGFFP
jgi:hypothetical protein